MKKKTPQADADVGDEGVVKWAKNRQSQRLGRKRGGEEGLDWADKSRDR